MKLISEEACNIEYITEGKDGSKNYFIEGVFMQAETKNRNGRIYPKEILQKEVKRYGKSFIESKRAFGELGHPDGPTVNLERVSHMIEELVEVDNNFMGRAKILDTATITPSATPQHQSPTEPVSQPHHSHSVFAENHETLPQLSQQQSASESPDDH